MTERLTDEQIVRLFQLCDEISAVQREIPAAPQGYRRAVALEIARATRVSLTQHNESLMELARLLAVPINVDFGSLARPENS